MWREITRPWVEAGELVVLGIVQEQHPARARLYMQWQGLDQAPAWPVAWDPFNTTGVEVVLVSTLIDEAGVILAAGLDPRDTESLSAMLARPSAAPGTRAAPLAEPFVSPDFGAKRYEGQDAESQGEELRTVLSAALFPEPDRVGGERLDGVIQSLESLATRDGAGAYASFAVGVARRMRHGGAHARADDFSAAVAGWSRALERVPGQYIWRRRLQQWGPRLDKPYPFYDWVEGARAEITARGLAPVALEEPLSGSEIASRQSVPAALSEPDPEGLLPRDDGGLVRVESAVVRHTGVRGPGAGEARATARIHVSLRPQGGASWSHDAPEPRLWLHGTEGTTVLAQAMPARYPSSEAGSSSGLLTLDAGVRHEDGDESDCRGYVVYWVCTASGECVNKRQDVAIPWTRHGGD